MSLTNFNRKLKNFDDLFFNNILSSKYDCDHDYDYDHEHEYDSMKISMKEINNEFIIKVDIPGVDKNKININIKNDNLLNISAENSENIEDISDKYYYSERFIGKKSRNIHLPKNIDCNNIKAKYIDGVLNINIPKLLDKSLINRTINIE